MCHHQKDRNYDKIFFFLDFFPHFLKSWKSLAYFATKMNEKEKKRRVVNHQVNAFLTVIYVIQTEPRPAFVSAYTARIIYGRSAYIQWIRTRRTLSSLAMNHADVDATTATVLILHKKADRKRERAEGRGKKEKTAVPYNTTTTAAAAAWAATYCSSSKRVEGFKRPFPCVNNSHAPFHDRPFFPRGIYSMEIGFFFFFQTTARNALRPFFVVVVVVVVDDDSTHK